MAVSVKMTKRDGSHFLYPGVDLKPEHLTWSIFGGPESAVIIGTGKSAALWEVVNWLRYGVQVDIDDNAAWWGYVHEIKLSTSEGGIGVSLNSLCNSVKVAYSYIEPGTGDVGERRDTAWDTDFVSAAEYGMRQVILSLDGATDASALATGAAYLDTHKYPIAFVEDGNADDLQVEIFCRGWWDTLGWKYYTNANTAAVATTEQIKTIALNTSDFISVVDVKHDVATAPSEYRAGDNTALDIITELLRVGFSSFPIANKYVLAKVTEDRRLVIELEPTYSFFTNTNLRYSLSGRLTNVWDHPWRRDPTGLWCDIMLPSFASFKYITSPTPFFVERAEYFPESKTWRIEPRGIMSAWELNRFTQG